MGDNKGPLYTANRQFAIFMEQNNVSILFSSYKSHMIGSIGVNPEGEIIMYFSEIQRAMGMGRYKDELYVSNIGNIIKYKSIGPRKTTEWKSTNDYIPRFVFTGPDVDIHDIRITSKGVFYIAALYNCIARPRLDGMFEPYWIPPWITTKDNILKQEDRCHLNGLCCVDDEPRFVTAACTGDVLGYWRDHTNEGIVYDIKEKRIVCSKLWSPHSPNWYDNKLWILESGTGFFGQVDIENKKFERKVFLPGFLRGMTFHDHFAIVCLSLDRHDHAFRKLPLKDELSARNQDAVCGIRIIDMNTFSVIYELNFNSAHITELYDVVILPTKMARVLSPNELDSKTYFDVVNLTETYSQQHIFDFSKATEISTSTNSNIKLVNEIQKLNLANKVAQKKKPNEDDDLLEPSHF